MEKSEARSGWALRHNSPLLSNSPAGGGGGRGGSSFRVGGSSSGGSSRAGGVGSPRAARRSSGDLALTAPRRGWRPRRRFTATRFPPLGAPRKGVATCRCVGRRGSSRGVGAAMPRRLLRGGPSRRLRPTDGAGGRSPSPGRRRPGDDAVDASSRESSASARPRRAICPSSTRGDRRRRAVRRPAGWSRAIRPGPPQLARHASGRTGASSGVGAGRARPAGAARRDLRPPARAGPFASGRAPRAPRRPLP